MFHAACGNLEPQPAGDVLSDLRSLVQYMLHAKTPSGLIMRYAFLPSRLSVMQMETHMHSLDVHCQAKDQGRGKHRPIYVALCSNTRHRQHADLEGARVLQWDPI